jgi:preprotein translocase subunit SecD
VVVHFTEHGREQFAQITEEYLDKQLAIMVDGRVMSAPWIKAHLTDGKTLIDPETEEEAKEVVERINEALQN